MLFCLYGVDFTAASEALLEAYLQKACHVDRDGADGPYRIPAKSLEDTALTVVGFTDTGCH